ncbi:hypothetical protein Dimus_032321, partial [Dionaea muscipula]
GVATLGGRLCQTRRCRRDVGEGSDALEERRLATSRAEARAAGRTASANDSELGFPVKSFRDRTNLS